MGMYTSAYFAYGIRIADTDPDRLEGALSGLDQRGDKKDHVGYLHAGKYDDDRTYLTTTCEEADLGKARQVHPEHATAEQYADWNHNLTEALGALGIADAPEPAWLVIPNVD